MPRVITAADIERAAQAGRTALPVEAGSVVPTVARQRAEQLGVTLEYGAPASNGASAPVSRIASNPAGGSSSSMRTAPGGRETAILNTPPPVVQPPNAPSARFVTPPDAPRYQPPAPAAPAARRSQNGQSAPRQQRRVDYPPPPPQGTHEIDIKPQYFPDVAVDNLFTIAMEMGAALWVVKDRLDVMEELLETKGVVTKEDIELYQRPADNRAERIKRRQEFINQIYGVVRQGAVSGPTSGY